MKIRVNKIEKQIALNAVKYIMEQEGFFIRLLGVLAENEQNMKSFMNGRGVPFGAIEEFGNDNVYEAYLEEHISKAFDDYRDHDYDEHHVKVVMPHVRITKNMVQEIYDKHPDHTLRLLNSAAQFSDKAIRFLDLIFDGKFSANVNKLARENGHSLFIRMFIDDIFDSRFDADMEMPPEYYADMLLRLGSVFQWVFQIIPEEYLIGGGPGMPKYLISNRLVGPEVARHWGFKDAHLARQGNKKAKALSPEIQDIIKNAGRKPEPPPAQPKAPEPARKVLNRKGLRKEREEREAQERRDKKAQEKNAKKDAKPIENKIEEALNKRADKK